MRKAYANTVEGDAGGEASLGYGRYRRAGTTGTWNDVEGVAVAASGGAGRAGRSGTRPRAGRERSTPGRRPSLTVDGIVSSAIDLADEEGLDAVSMPRLARELGKGTMSLYRYVANKEELVTLMVDAAIGPPATSPDTAPDWRSALVDWARETRAIFLKHPWILRLATTRRMMGPNETAHLELALRALAGTGLTPAQMIDTVLLINGYVRGAAQPAVEPTRSQDDTVVSHDPITASSAGPESESLYPTLARLTAQDPAAMSRHRQVTDGFEFGLQRILDGLEAHIQ